MTRHSQREVAEGDLPRLVERWCADCGYGIAVRRRELPACPMCRGASWHARPRLASAA